MATQLNPRKKFSLQAEIKCSLHRFKKNYAGAWSFVPDKQIVRKLTEAYTNRVLYVKGQSALQLGLQRIELLAYMHSLPLPDEKEKPTGKRLAQIPLFFVDEFPQMKYTSQRISYKASLNEMRQNYLEQERQHKQLEGHHPDGVGWNGGIDSTIECVFDVYSGLLKFHTVKSSYIKLLDVLKDDKFANLDPEGILHALLHIIVRGVSNQSRIAESASWRCKEFPQQQLWKYTNDFANGIPPAYLIQGYRAELAVHSRLITTEIKRLRIASAWHDCTKFQFKSIYWYCWNWGVYAYMNEQSRKMLDLNINMADISPENNAPTMFSMGSSFAEGALSNPEFSKVLACARQFPEELERKSEKIIETIDDKIEARHSEFKNTAQEILEEFKKTSENLVDSALEKITERANILGVALAEVMDPMMAVLTSMKGLVESIIEQVNQYLKPIDGFGGIKITADSLLDCLKYYVLYLNVDSLPLKMVMVFLMLKALGITGKIFQWVLQFWKWSSSVVVDGERVDAEETSFLEWIQEAPLKFITMVGGAFASMAKGSSLSMSEFWKMSKDLSDKFRNIHFISMGIAGVERIFDYARRFWLFITQWISVHIFGRTPEKEAKAKEAMKLIVLIKYFGTEAGLNAIRMSENARVRAEGLFPEYLRLLAETRDNREYRVIFNDLERNFRQVKEISNFVTRFRSVSNFQPTMFHIQLVGKPGIGKSTLTKQIVTSLTKSLWPGEPKPSFYSLNMNLEYFDGYAGQKIMIADDVYKMNEPKHMTSTIGLITNTPVILPMADLADKGVQLTSEIFLSSTNTAYPLAKDVLCMEAVHRRRHMLVQVTCDPRVIDEGCSQFSEALFKKYYPGQDKAKFPHLKFGLIKPVPKEFGGAAEQVLVGDDEFKVYADYAKLLQEANFKIASSDKELDPCFYFSENNLPDGFKYPASGWDYDQFISNCVVRFRAFRGMEGTYTSESKFSHAESCLSEIDLIFSQSDDIPNCPEIPPVKLIENCFTELMTPYGSEHPIGSEVMKGRRLVPELDKVDFDEVVDKIIDEKPKNTDSPTSDTLNLEAERLRRQRILSKRQRKAVPMEIRNMLKIQRFGLKRKMLLVENPTHWEPSIMSGKNMAMVFQSAQLLNFANKKFDVPRALNRSLREEARSDVEYEAKKFSSADPQWNSINGWFKTIAAWAEGPVEYLQVIDNMIRTYLSEDMYWPEGFDSEGCSTGIPIDFFHRLEKVDGLWFMDVTNLSCDLKPPTVTKKLYNGDEEVEYKIPMDIAYWLGQMCEFRKFLSKFFSLTEEQRETLVQDAKFRNKITGTYNYDKIAEDCESIYKKIGYKTMSYLTKPFKWIADACPAITAYAAYTLIFVSVVWAVKQICSLFNPEPTSKVLHRGPQSNIVYRGTPTSLSQVCEGLMTRNVVKIKITDSKMSVSGQALHNRQYLIMNKHLTRWMQDEDLLLTLITGTGETDYWVKKSDIVEDPNGDLAILFSRYIPSARAIEHHLITEDEYSHNEFRENVSILTRKDKITSCEHFPTVGKVENITLENTNTSTLLAKCLMLCGNTILGNSGSTVITRVGSMTKIIGIQAWKVDALYAPKIAVQVITKELYDKLTSLVKGISEHPVIERTYDPEAEECEPTSAFEYVPPAAIIRKDEHVVGEVGRNLIKPTFISPILDKLDIKSNRVPACMSERDPRLYKGREIHPMAHSLGKYYRGRINPITPKVANRAADMLYSYLRNRLDTDDYSPLSIEQTITGTREDGSNPMNLKSSPGIPFIFEKRERKGKRDYMEIGEDGEVIHIDENFINEYFQFENSLRLGKVPYTRAYDFPKDELRGIEKALGSETTPPKTRSVTCMNVFYILAWRRYTLKFWSALHRAADGTSIFCPGINPEGPEWNNLYHTLNKHPNAVDFDVSNWDGYVFSQVFYKVLDVILRCMRVKPHSEVGLLLASIFFDVMNCYIQFLDIIYQKSRGIVSGFPGTAEVNSLVHLFLLFCIWIILTKGTIYNNLESFNRFLSAGIYGDDIIITFADEVAPMVNGLSIKQIYEQIGYAITSATKSSEVEFSKKLLDCKFLKSTWREFVPGYWIRKMDMDVAYDLVHWVRAKQHPRQQFFENYVDALHIAFGNGKQVFEKFQRAVNSALTIFHEDNINFSYEDFEIDYIQRYLPNLLDCKL